MSGLTWRLRARSGNEAWRRLMLGLLALAAVAVWLVALGGSARAQGVTGYQEITGSTVTVPGFQTLSGTATCPSGEVVLSGGYMSSAGNLRITASGPVDANGGLSNTTWTVTGFDSGDGQGSFTPYAICVSSAVAGYVETSGANTVPAGSFSQLTQTCRPGTVIVGGGFASPNTGLIVNESNPTSSSTVSSTTWTVSVDNLTGESSESVTLYAVCVASSLSGYSEQLNQRSTAGPVSSPCPSGSLVIGGGGSAPAPSIDAPLVQNPTGGFVLSSTTWSVDAASTGGGVIGSIAICATQAPVVTTIKPPLGPAAGGNSVTIAGSGFTGATAVSFGSTPAAAFTVTSANQISATAPAGSGAVDVTVTTAGGTSATNSSDVYKYVPSVTAVSPTTGPTTGGTTITITGTGFTGATSVAFGSIAAGSFTVNSSTKITATAPAGSAGVADVTVTTPGGTSATSTADQYTYVSPPTVTGVSPGSGPAAGGTAVTITGTGFTGASAVKFGSGAANSFTVNSATQITATAPAGAGGVDVTVTTPAGTSATSSSDVFKYVPSVTAVSPTSGPTAGGTSVTITGTGFTGATAVKFGATAATGFTVNTATQITATAPPGSAGVVDITATTAGGTSATGAGDRYTYTAAPTITSVSPTAGPLGGGTSVTITGANLAGASAVRFGAANAASFTVNSPTQMTATSPSGTGTVDIQVTTPGGTSATSTADRFTYTSAPIVTGVSPAAGPTAGGTSVTITGANLAGASAVKFGTANSGSFTVVNSTQITATSPSGSGTVDVRITTPGGTTAAGPADRFTFVAPPSITGVSPASGPESGGTSVTITGANLAGASTVSFGSSPAASFTVNSPTQITAVSLAGTGTVDVQVTAPGGTTAISPADRFTFAAPPSITGVSPASGPESGGTSVTITGANLAGASTVSFGGNPAASFTVNSATQITAVSPAGTGSVDVRVITPGGTTVTLAADTFVYAAVATPSLAASGGKTFAGAMSLTVNGPLASFTSSDPSAPASEFSASVDWGDGSTSNGAIAPAGGPFTVSASHVYAAPGSFTIRITITDSSHPSAQSIATDTVTVTAGSPQAPGFTADPPQSHSSSGATFSGKVNPHGLATTAHFEYGLDPKYAGAGGPPVYDQQTPPQVVGSDFTTHIVTATVNGLVPNARYHVRLVAINASGATVGPDQTFSTRKDPPPPAPVLGQSFNAGPVRGVVLIELPPSAHPGAAHSTAFAKGKSYFPLTEARRLPIGTKIDARRGTLRLTTASFKIGKTQTATFSGGLFKLASQTRKGLNKGLANVALIENAFFGAPSFAACQPAKASQAANPTATEAKLSAKVLQTLHASDNHGRFRTTGKHSAATVRGTVWTISERCDGTLTTVKRGTVTVQDFGLRKTITLHAGHSYLARAITKKPKEKKRG